jgi:transcription initiation factor TFIID subunit TAF12
MPIKKSGRARKPAARGHHRAKPTAKKPGASMLLFDKVRNADPNSLAVAAAGILAVALVITGLATTPAETIARAGASGTGQRSPMLNNASAAGTNTISHSTMPEGSPKPAAKSAAAKPAPVTIAGCLERDGETFRLRDTSGSAVPKSRSWKSGFLRKGPAAVAVQDPARRLNLTRHVGERVSVTGTLDGKALRGSSLRRVSTSCEEERQVKI